jgi:SAM-dependent methyltransferase
LIAKDEGKEAGRSGEARGNGQEEVIDTRTFADRSPSQYKAATVRHWSAAPCGSNYAPRGQDDLAYFEGIERHRYATHPWIRDAIDSFEIDGRDVLEVGYGMGTDHLRLARRGGRMFGIDLTPRNLEETRRRLRLYGLQSRLTIGDAENLPYGDGTLDFVYSFGVIHHTPDTGRAVSEIHRVLRTGGSCWITVYHRNSLFFWWTVLSVNYALRGGFRKRSLQGQLSLIEHPNTDEDMVIRLYRRQEFQDLFRGFRSVRGCVRHLLPADLVGLDALFRDPSRPNRLLDWVGRRLGWYVVVEATK